MSSFGYLNSEYRPPRQTRAVQSNTMAEGFRQADPRFTTAQNDRAGVSRGAGAEYLGGVRSGNALAQARNDALNIGFQDFAADRERASRERMQQDAFSDSMRGQQLAGQAQSNQFAIGNMGLALQRQQMFDADRLGFLRSAGGALMGLMR